MNDTTVPFVQDMIGYFERLIERETNLIRKTVLYDNKIHLERILLDFWKEKVEKLETEE